MNPVPYRNADLPIEARLADLLPRMTLKEKCAQLIGPGLDETDGAFSLELARRLFKDGISYVNTHHLRRKTRQTDVVRR